MYISIISRSALLRTGNFSDKRCREKNSISFFDVSLTVHLSIILVINQLNAQMIGL